MRYEQVTYATGHVLIWDEESQSYIEADIPEDLKKRYTAALARSMEVVE